MNCGKDCDTLPRDNEIPEGCANDVLEELCQSPKKKKRVKSGSIAIK